MGFKENLKMLRKTKGMTQEELGKSINKSKLTVIRYEKGETFPNLEILKEICKIFDIELTNFLMNIEYENKKYTLEEIKELLRDKRKQVAHSVSHEVGHIALSKIENGKNFTDVYKKIWNNSENTLNENDFLKLFENKTDIKNFIYDFSLMLRYDLIQNHENISHSDRLKILEDLKKYYLFLMSNYKNNNN